MRNIEKAKRELEAIMSELIDLSIDIAEDGNEPIAEDILEMVNDSLECIWERIDDTAREQERKEQKPAARVTCTVDISGRIVWNR